MPFPWLMNPELSSYPKKNPLFYCSSAPVSILLGASLVEGSSSLASFPSFGVFSSCVERLRGQSARWSLPSSPVSLPLPLVYRLPWLTRLLASMTHQCAFSPSLYVWLPHPGSLNVGDPREAALGTLHPSVPGWSCLIPPTSVGGA